MQNRAIDPDTLALAQSLAERRNTSVDDVVREALNAAWQRERKTDELREKLKTFQAEIRALSDPSKAQPVDKAFIDSLYEDD